MSNLDQSISEKVKQWLQGNYDVQTKQQIQALVDQQAITELTDAFYKNLEFGTGGLRGIMGPGPNRVNRYTIGTATQGLSNYLNQKYPSKTIQVAIAYDSRNHSAEFARITANVFSANGIVVHLFEALRPTPELSFAVRRLHCQAGVVITASHNPKEYNGYKAYGADGGQLIAPDDALVMKQVAQIKTIDEVRFEPIEENIKPIGREMDELYLKNIAELSLEREAIRRQDNLKIVYSPIHGTGITLVPEALKQLGFKNIFLVEEQIQPNGNFPTVIYPNPEEQDALSLAIEKAKAVQADLVLATDPDADRVGIAIRDDQNEFILLNGNQTASLLTNYLLNAWERKGKLKGKEYIVKTIVTTHLIEQIAQTKKVPCYNTLTGFKFIGAIMTALEGKQTFIGGGEESYGFLIGDLVRDKDAVVSCAFIAEMAAYYRNLGMSLYDALLEMYQQYGLYKEKLVSITKKGKTGADEIKAMMESFRSNTPKKLGGSRVIKLKDYELGKETDLINGAFRKLDFPKSDVLQFITEDGSIISARPSGTEPKIKFYCSVKASLSNRTAFKQVDHMLDAKIGDIMLDLGCQ